MVASESTSAPEDTRAREGDIEGPRFFSKPGIRSGQFVAGVIACLGAVGYDASILYRRWHLLSTSAAFILLMAGMFILEFLLKTLQDRGRMQDIYSGALPPQKPRGMSVDGLLDLAAGALTQPLYWTSLLAFALLFCIDNLLLHLK